MIVAAGPLLVVSAYPELTLPQADDGNVLVLSHRARARGIDVETRTVHCGEELPPADIYVTGGLEDEDAAVLAAWLDRGGVLRRALEAGAGLLAVNSGYQVLGESFELPDGVVREGLGLLGVHSSRGPRWMDGPVVTRPDPDIGLPAMSGYESHYGITALGDRVAPLALLEIGHGNGRAASTARETKSWPRRPVRERMSKVPTGGPATPQNEGAIAGRIVGTYLHGPVLARNPELADLLLGRVLGRALDPLPAPFAEDARRRRIAEARRWIARGRPKIKM